jgi:pyrroloquinoline quinone biosynthesis protein D
MFPERRLLLGDVVVDRGGQAVEDWLSSMAERGMCVNATDRPRLGGHYRLRVGETPDARCLVDGEKTVRLNETAAEIIQRCDGRHSVAAVIDEMRVLYDGAGEEEIAGAVRNFLELALNKGWIDLERA